MKLLFTLILSAFSMIVFGQSNSEKLIGKWAFEDIYEKGALDAQTVKMIDMFFSSMTFEFNTDGLYQALIMGIKDEGKWSVEGLNVSLISNRGNTVKLEIIELNNDELIVKMQRGSFILSKVKGAEPTVLEAGALPYETVAATKEQASKKWMLVRKELLNDSSEIVKETIGELLQGSYLKLEENGDYEVLLFGLKENGTWHFGDENKSIITQGEIGENKLNIIYISETELTLINGLQKERWVFKAMSKN